MNRKINYIIAILFALTFTNSFAGDDKPINVNQLPTVAQSFIKKYFSKSKVVYATVETGVMNKSYEVKLNNGTEIDFDSKGNWKEVDCKRNVVPASLIPNAIKNAVNRTFPNTKIVQIEKDKRGYEIKLSNGMEMKFNKKFQVVKVDD